MDLERLKIEAENGDPEARYLLFREQRRRGEITLPAVPKTHSRHCFRCKAELTDEVSLSRGAGDTCWGHMNKEQHRVVPDFERVKKLHGEFIANFDVEYWEAMVIVADFGEHLYKGKITKKASKEMCRKILWALSFGLSKDLSRVLLNMVRALGYPLLANLLEKDAVIGKATVTAEDYRMQLVSPRPSSSVADALRQSGGRYDWRIRAWVWPIEKAEQGAEAIKEHFLNLEGLEESLEVLRNLPPQEKPDPVAQFIKKEENGEMWIETPFNRSFVDSLKREIPWKVGNVICRQWDGGARMWVVRTPEYIEVAKNLLNRHYVGA